MKQPLMTVGLVCLVSVGVDQAPPLQFLPTALFKLIKTLCLSLEVCSFVGFEDIKGCSVLQWTMRKFWF